MKSHEQPIDFHAMEEVEHMPILFSTELMAIHHHAMSVLDQRAFDRSLRVKLLVTDPPGMNNDDNARGGAGIDLKAEQ